MNKWLTGLLLISMLLFPVQIRAGVPLETIKANVTGVLDVLRDPKLQGENGKKVKEQKVVAAAEKLFDFIELSKRTLGLHWNKLSPDQRREFVELFKTLLKDAYVEKITAYTNQQVNFPREVSLSENTVEVQSTIVTKNAAIPIYYRVIKRDQDWKVFDVVIEGVSLISNYRTQFREILGNNPPEALIDTLRKKKVAK